MLRVTGCTSKMGFLTFKPSYPGVPGKPFSPLSQTKGFKKNLIQCDLSIWNKRVKINHYQIWNDNSWQQVTALLKTLSKITIPFLHSVHLCLVYPWKTKTKKKQVKLRFYIINKTLYLWWKGQ